MSIRHIGALSSPCQPAKAAPVVQPFAVALTERGLHDWPGAGGLGAGLGGLFGAAAAELGTAAAPAARMAAPALTGRAARKLVTCEAVQQHC